MAKSKTSKNLSENGDITKKYVIQDDVPIPAYVGARSPFFTYPEEYALVDKLENKQSFFFNTQEDFKKFDTIRKAIQTATKKEKMFTIKKVDRERSGIWRNDKKGKKQKSNWSKEAREAAAERMRKRNLDKKKKNK